MHQILINVEPYEKRVAMTSRGVLEELHIERSGAERLAGNIYKGVINSVVPGIGAVFVDIGTGKNGFLYLKDIEEKSLEALLEEEIVVEKKAPRDKGFLKHLRKGQELIVQVVKEPVGTKGPLLTSDISLPGKYLVLMPFNDTTGISKRVEDREKRLKLRETLKELYRPRGIGCIARTQSVRATPRQLKSEFKYLANLWSRIQLRAERQKAPVLIYEEYDLPLRIVRDYFEDDIERILVDSRDEYKKICRFANSIQSKLRRRIFYYRGKTPLYEKYGIEERIKEVFQRKVFLKSGGSIVIEQTESLVAIDVNTGKFTGRKDPEETAFKTNTEAAEEIARQVMLRDIGGIIVIDFIDMAERFHRSSVYRALESAFRRDKARINILTVSKIGLVEMTRQRVRKNLESLSFRDCPYCNGMGRVKTPATIAIEAFRKLEEILARRKTREITLTAHPDVVEYMKTSLGNTLRSIHKRFRKKVALKSDLKLHVEDVYFE